MNKSDFKKVKKERDEYTARIIRIFFAKPISKVLIKFIKITPNQITLFSFIFGLIGIFFLIRGGYKNIVIGATFSFLYIIFDCVDGEVARAKKLTSTLGFWLDGIVGFIVVPFTMLALAVGLRTYNSLLIGSIAALCFPMQFLFIHFFKSEISKNEKRIKTPISSKFDFMRYVYGSALFFPLLLIGALINMPILVLLFFAIFGNLFWILILFLQFLNIKKENSRSH